MHKQVLMFNHLKTRHCVNTVHMQVSLYEQYHKRQKFGVQQKLDLCHNARKTCGPALTRGCKHLDRKSIKVSESFLLHSFCRLWYVPKWVLKN